MAIVITDGKYYFKSGNKYARTQNTEEAATFPKREDAIQFMWNDVDETKFFYVYDTETQENLWQWISREEAQKMMKARDYKSAELKRNKPKKVCRRNYSDDTRKLIYIHAKGRCALCGRKLTLDEMTLDHIEPLAMGGADAVENLQACCLACNRFKGSVLPVDFMQKITDIFLYQMEKEIRWKIFLKPLYWMLIRYAKAEAANQ